MFLLICPVRVCVCPASAFIVRSFMEGAVTALMAGEAWSFAMTVGKWASESAGASYSSWGWL